MSLEITVDYEAQSISMIVDNSIAIMAYKESDDSITYSRMVKLDSEDFQEKLKQVCEILFSIDEA